ncbi:TPA: hydrolase [Candidatus Marinimicrobia bacterium]|nr:hydrolase [Candidatus Neomarinimicrobiota bacterium]HBY18886.1 hydrolase [Candidatus Neomarinimicrobiota bacterium]
MIIAVDFDGTLVEHRYPAIGKEIPYAFETLKILQQKGHKLILWTYRTGDSLTEAVEYCKKKGVEFWAVNESYPGENREKNRGRKINAEIYIDDRNIGGLVSWTEILQLLHPEDYDLESLYKKNIKRNIFRRFFDRLR